MVMARPPPQEPWITRWAMLMPRGGSGQHMSWRLEFFEWLDHQLIVVQDWPYAKTNFRGDPDLLLPPGEHWDERGNKVIFYF